MNKTTLRNVKASVEVREVKDELSEAELKTISGGRVMHGDFAIVRNISIRLHPSFFDGEDHEHDPRAVRRSRHAGRQRVGCGDRRLGLVFRLSRTRHLVGGLRVR